MTSKVACKKKQCRWWLLCQSKAVTTAIHPVLGKVPCCAECAAQAKEGK